MAHIAILGASGLIGNAIAVDLKRRGLAVRGHARRFARAQAEALGDAAISSPLMTCDAPRLQELLQDADIVINCIGILQDEAGARTEVVHRDFTARLATACSTTRLLIHFSVPGEPQNDFTDFSRSKRAAEHAIAASGAPFVILRPGFVIAPGAYGGSALMRSLAALPLRLPLRTAQMPFAAVAVSDICKTVAQLAVRWRGGERGWRVTWDVMEQSPGSVGQVLEFFRRHWGGPAPRLAVPEWVLDVAGWAGNAVARLGWRPPIRQTAIREMRRGVAGDPQPWIDATGIAPLPAAAALPPATVQEKWFARLYLLKALALVTLVLFWVMSGLIALTVAFQPARAILLTHGFALPLANLVTIVTSLADISIGMAIGWRRTCRIGLIVGILQSLFYMIAAAVLTPDIWLEPLGALVKTGPAIVLMLVCLALLEDR